MVAIDNRLGLLENKIEQKNAKSAAVAALRPIDAELRGMAKTSRAKIPALTVTAGGKKHVVVSLTGGGSKEVITAANLRRLIADLGRDAVADYITTETRQPALTVAKDAADTLAAAREERGLEAIVELDQEETVSA